MPGEHLPLRRMRSNPKLTVAITRGGGHVGFVGGPTPLARRFWAEREAAAFLAGQLS